MSNLVTLSTRTLTLQNGVKLGDNTLHEITITKPLVSHLKGVSLQKLMEMQTDEIIKLIPRVTNPSLPAHALDTMDFGEFVQLCGEVMGFLVGADSTDIHDA